MNQEQNNLNSNNFNTKGDNGAPNNQSLNNTYNQNIYNNANINQQMYSNQPQSASNYQQPINQMNTQQTTVQPMNTFQGMNTNNSNLINKPQKKVNIGLIIGIISICLIIAIVLFLILGNKENAKSVVKKYINEVVENNYTGAFEYVYIPDGGFVSLEDYNEYIKLNDYFTKYENKKVKDIKQITSTEEDAVFNVSLIDDNDNSSTQKIRVILDDNKKWKVKEEGLYTEKWNIIIPGNYELYIDERKVETKYITTQKDLKDVYVLPAVANFDKKFKITGDLGNKEFNLVPALSNSGYNVTMELMDDNLVKKGYDYIKTSWNEIYAAYIAKKDISEIKKYFSSDFDTKSIEQYYTSDLNSCTNVKSTAKYTNYRITNVISGDKNYVITDKIITFNFGYTLEWNVQYFGFNTVHNQSMNRYSKIRLILEDNEFKIYEMPDGNLFNHCTQFTKEF